MKATIYFVNNYGPPLEIRGNYLGTSEVGSYTKIKDYEKEDNRMLAQIMTDKILYIQYTDEVIVTVKDIKNRGEAKEFPQ